MKTPTTVDMQLFFAHVYDPQKAHEYYVRTRKLKGRQGFAKDKPTKEKPTAHFGKDPRAGKTAKEIHKDARAKQRQELTQAIKTLETNLAKLKILIRKKVAEQDSVARKMKGKKERSAKEKLKPKTAAEKAKASRASKQYQAKNQQKVKTQSHQKSASKSSGGTSTSTQSSTSVKRSGHTIGELESLAIRVEGKIAVAKQKLAAL